MQSSAGQEGGPAQQEEQQPRPGLTNEPEPVSQAVSAEAAGQAGEPVFVHAAVQTIQNADAAVQCELPPADAEEIRAQLASSALAKFLRRAVPVCEQALQQNELADVLQDEFAGLAEDEAQEGGATGGSAADKVAVLQSFTDAVHSKGRVLSAVGWTAQKGVVAVACAEPSSATERGSGGGKQQHASPEPGGILLWNYRDPIHPEVVLQAPADVLAFAFNPAQPQWVAAGCRGGQVALWNLDQLARQREKAARLQPGGGGGGGGGGPRRSTSEHVAGTGSEGARSVGAGAFFKPNVLPPEFVSQLDASHQASVGDLHWLPGLAASRDGRLEPAAAEHECNLFATTAMDGRVLVWDMRIYSGGRRRNRPTGTEDDVVEWKPVLVLPVHSTTGQPLPCTRLCLDPRPSSTTRLILGSLEGDMAVVDANIRAVDTNRAHCAVEHAASSCGRVLWLAYSPFFPDLLLAVADSGFLVWRDAGGQLGQQPLLQSRFSEAFFYTAGCWSPTKPGVVLLGRLDGKLEVWDLLDRSHAPVVVAPLTPAPILALAFSPGPAGAASRSSAHHVLAVSDGAGALHVVDLPRSLRRRGHGEVRAMAALVEREEARNAYVQERQAARAKLQKDMEPKRRASVQFAQSAAVVAASAAAAGAAGKQQQAAGDAALDPEQQAELAYQQLEAEWRVKLCMAQPPSLEAPPSARGTARSAARGTARGESLSSRASASAAGAK